MKLTKKQLSLHWRLWSQVCHQQGWTGDAVEQGKRRHAVYAAALGSDKSLQDFCNRDFDAVLAAFRKLASPDCLNAQLEVDAHARGEDPGERRRLIWKVESLMLLIGPAYAAEILRDTWHTDHHDDLTNDQLEQFRNTLNNRLADRKKRADIDRLTSPAEAENPF